MKRSTFVSGFVVTAILFSLLLAIDTSAQSSGSYDLSWNTIDGGGAMVSSGGGYELGSTIGQPDAGVLSGGGYTLAGGFWYGATATYKIFLPLMIKNF